MGSLLARQPKLKQGMLDCAARLAQNTGTALARELRVMSTHCM